MEGEKSLKTDSLMLDEREKIQKICDFFGFGEIVALLSLSKSASVLFFQLRTTRGVYIFKSYALQKKNQLQCSIKIKKFFADKENYFYENEKNCWIISEWQNGKVLNLSEIKIMHIQFIAKILGKMHKKQDLSLSVFPVLSFDIEIIQDEKFKKYYEQFQKYFFLLKENLVVSHGDLLPQNIVWDENEKPILIDWDNAGLINQDIDLFNTAINWAGIESGTLNQSFYKQFIQSYLLENPREIQIDRAVIAASLGSWLNWWAINQKLGNQKEVEKTINALKILEGIL
jgi:thiamine kinase-like enzyme